VPAAHAAAVSDAGLMICRAVRPGDLVLVKGSRSIGTERVVAMLSARGDPT
jgi:UDP-N-acetylmuramyl pentapeptide synthase